MLRTVEEVGLAGLFQGATVHGCRLSPRVSVGQSHLNPLDSALVDDHTCCACVCMCLCVRGCKWVCVCVYVEPQREDGEGLANTADVETHTHAQTRLHALTRRTGWRRWNMAEIA